MKISHQSMWISISILVFVSYYKYSYYPQSKKIMFCLFPIIFYYAFCSYKINVIIKFVILFSIFVVEIAEAAAYYTTKKTFSLEFLNSLDVKEAFQNMRSVAIMISILTAFIAVLVILNIALPRGLIAFSFINILNLLVIILMYVKFVHIHHELFKIFRDDSFQTVKPLLRLIQYMNQKPKVVPTKPRKNLLVFVMESTELQNLGAFNRDDKHLMPYLSSVALNSTVFTNVKPQPMTGFSISSFFCSICGFPVIFRPNVRLVGYRQGDIQLSPKFKCIPDYLHALNYSNYFVMTGNSNWGNLQDVAALHHYKVLTSKIHHGNGDKIAINWMIQNLIPKLKSEQPFYLTFESTDTHNGLLPNSCIRQQKNNMRDRFYQEYDCLDVYLSNLIQSLKDNDLYDNTEIVIYGDHFFMGHTYNFVNPRSLVIILPKHKFGNITFDTSLYDLSHLMLHLLGVKVTPKFPFGNNPFSPHYIYHPPTSDEIRLLPKLYFKYIQPNAPKGF